MKNKKLLYLLVPVTLLIWGFVFYKIFSAASGNDNDPTVMKEPEAASASGLKPDTFSLLAGYRDPFLGTLKENKKPVAIHLHNPPLKKEEKVALWPNLVYGGMIKNQNSNKKLALVNVNGQENIMLTGDVKEGVKLLVIFPDSIKVVLGKEQRIIVKRK